MILAGDIFEEILNTLKSDGRSSENRKCTRVGIRSRVKIVPLVNGSRCAPTFAWSRDISASGIGIIHSEPLKLRSRFVVELQREENVPIQLLCEVVRKENVNSGVYMIGAMFVQPEVHSSSAAPQATANSAPPPPVDAEIQRIRNAVIGE
jgi:hypothetical protein